MARRTLGDTQGLAETAGDDDDAAPPPPYTEVDIYSASSAGLHTPASVRSATSSSTAAGDVVYTPPLTPQSSSSSPPARPAEPGRGGVSDRPRQLHTAAAAEMAARWVAHAHGVGAAARGEADQVRADVADTVRVWSGGGTRGQDVEALGVRLGGLGLCGGGRGRGRRGGCGRPSAGWSGGPWGLWGAPGWGERPGSRASSVGSSSSSESIESITLGDDPTRRQLHTARHLLRQWVDSPEKQITPEGARRMNENIRAAGVDGAKEQLGAPDVNKIHGGIVDSGSSSSSRRSPKPQSAEDYIALRREVDAMARQWKEAKKAQRQARRDAKKERRRQKKAERRERREEARAARRSRGWAGNETAAPGGRFLRPHTTGVPPPPPPPPPPPHSHAHPHPYPAVRVAIPPVMMPEFSMRMGFEHRWRRGRRC